MELGEDAAQLLLCDGGADGADRYPDHPRRLVLPGALPIGARGVVDGVLQDAGDRAAVFRREEQPAAGGRARALEALDGHCRAAVATLYYPASCLLSELLDRHISR